MVLQASPCAASAPRCPPPDQVSVASPAASCVPGHIVCTKSSDKPRGTQATVGSAWVVRGMHRSLNAGFPRVQGCGSGALPRGGSTSPARCRADFRLCCHSWMQYHFQDKALPCPPPLAFIRSDASFLPASREQSFTYSPRTHLPSSPSTPSNSSTCEVRLLESRDDELK